MWTSKLGSGARRSPARKYVRAKPTKTASSETTAMPEKNTSSGRTFRRALAAAVAIALLERCGAWPLGSLASNLKSNLRPIGNLGASQAPGENSTKSLAKECNSMPQTDWDDVKNRDLHSGC